MRILLLLLLLLPSPVGASNVAFCDPLDSDVPNRVVQWRLSVDTPTVEGRPDIIINPNVSAITERNPRYWKCSGASIIDMTNAEKAALDADRIAVAAQRTADEAELASKRLLNRTAEQDWDTLTMAEQRVANRRALRIIDLMLKGGFTP